MNKKENIKRDALKRMAKIGLAATIANVSVSLFAETANVPNDTPASYAHSPLTVTNELTTTQRKQAFVDRILSLYQDYNVGKFNMNNPAEKFLKWTMNAIMCTDDDNKIVEGALAEKGSSYYFEIPNKDYDKLAKDIIKLFNSELDPNYESDKVEIITFTSSGSNFMDRAHEVKFKPEFHGQLVREIFYDFYDAVNDNYDGRGVQVDEIASYLYAMDKACGGTGKISADMFLQTIVDAVENKGHFSGEFRKNRENFSKEHYPETW